MDILNQLFNMGNEGVPWGRQTNPFVDFMRQLVLKLTEGAGNSMGVSPMNWWNEWQGATAKGFKDEMATAQALGDIKEKGYGTIPTSASSFYPEMINYPDLAQKLGFTQETDPMRNIGGISGVGGESGGFSPDRGIMPTIDVETPEHRAFIERVQSARQSPQIEQDLAQLAEGKEGYRYIKQPGEESLVEKKWRYQVMDYMMKNPGATKEDAEMAISTYEKPDKPDAFDKLLGRTEGYLTREQQGITGPPMPQDMIKQRATDMMIEKTLGLNTGNWGLRTERELTTKPKLTWETLTGEQPDTTTGVAPKTPILSPFQQALKAIEEDTTLTPEQKQELMLKAMAQFGEM